MILLEEFYFLMDEEVIIYECTKGHCHKTSINVRLLRLDSFMFFFVSQFVLPNLFYIFFNLGG
jgi:hypothetical protein